MITRFWYCKYGSISKVAKLAIILIVSASCFPLLGKTKNPRLEKVSTFLALPKQVVSEESNRIKPVLGELGIVGSAANEVSLNIIVRSEACRLWAKEKDLQIDSVKITNSQLERLGRHLLSNDAKEKIVFINLIHELDSEKAKMLRWEVNGRQLSGTEIMKLVSQGMRYPTMPIKSRSNFELLLEQAIEGLKQSNSKSLKQIRSVFSARLIAFDRALEEQRAEERKGRSYQRFVIESGIDWNTILVVYQAIQKTEAEIEGRHPPVEPDWKHYDALFGLRDDTFDDAIGAFALKERANNVRDPFAYIMSKTGRILEENRPNSTFSLDTVNKPIDPFSKIKNYYWGRGDAPVQMNPTVKGLAVFSSICGKFAGRGESVEVVADTDNFWYLKGKSMQFIALQATAIEPIKANPFGIPRRVDLPANGKAVRLIQSKNGFAFLSAVVGNYLDGRCSVRVRLDKDGWWYLEGSGPKTRFGSATVVPWAEGVAPPVVESYRWQKDDKPIKMLRPDEGFCFLSGINGGFRGGGERVSVTLKDDGFYYLEGNTMLKMTSGEAVAIRFQQDNKASAP